MKLTWVPVATLLIAFTPNVYAADDSNALIELDKKWGESAARGHTTGVGKYLADKALSISETGVRGKQAELAQLKPAPEGTRYEATDYKVMFLDPDTAIMTHSTKGTDAHYSLHVWSRKGGTWQVIATSTTPAASAK
jgi:hypothetical protein